ncbi:anaerobic ribonucleoside-triphosphate reductase activating protein [Marichromatium bheemlicum]|uniref:Anaerobic ribonucleoside-triphosphate reductase activating protein n=1 Tax=Marichromatium bheemlicum TaxID=365339 RepID=A0ABX1I7U6_9GAMM|nr:anaerobic ribonucleoside-triphosphate reductase activating protein [Marichromatium bheemlicum]NKN32307.1 anaerobic ribonucleoside-triphosphate reductase activating protein [Marichromatium bheemlicum]
MRDPAEAAALRVGGLTPLTTIDYPGELAAVIYCQGCPWRCRYCHNGHLLEQETSDEETIAWDQVIEFLGTRRGLLDAVVFSGGEPTAQGALAAAMRETRALGFKIGLHTGGAYPQRLRRILPLVDWVALDIKALAADYPALTGVPGSGEPAWESLALLLTAAVGLEVRTTVPPDWDQHQLAALVEALAATGVDHYCLQRCDPTHSLDPGLHDQPATPLRQLVAGLDTSRFTQFKLRGAGY